MFDAIIYKIEVNTLVLSILVQLTANALSPWDWFHRVSVQRGPKMEQAVVSTLSYDTREGCEQ